MLARKYTPGFTVVEILVVLLVLGILVGLTAFGYQGWQQGLAKSQVKSDLNMALVAMEQARNFSESGYPTQIPATFKANKDVTPTYIWGDGQKFCIEMVSKTYSSVKYFIDTTQGKTARAGSCPASPVPPAAPSPSAVANSSSVITVSWSSVAGATSYEVRYGTGSPSLAAGCSSSPCTIGGLNAATAYTVSVVASNTAGSSPAGIASVTTQGPALGQTWTAITAPAANQWMAVAYGAGTFVAVSNTGTERVMTSSDGTNWTLRSSAVAAAGNWTNIEYDNGRFIALGTSTGTNRVMTSLDGITWTAGTMSAYNWEGVGYGASKYVALNANTPTTAYTSTDGLTWASTAGIPSGNWSEIAFGNGRFAAGAISGTNRMMYSSDGTTWTVSTLTNGSFSGISDVIYAGGKFVASANSSTNNVLTSSDGITWTAVTVPELSVGATLNSLEYTGVFYVGVGNNRIMTSPDAITWTNRTSPEANPWRSLAYGNGKLVAVSASGTNRIMVSP